MPVASRVGERAQVSVILRRIGVPCNEKSGKIHPSSHRRSRNSPNPTGCWHRGLRNGAQDITDVLARPAMRRVRIETSDHTPVAARMALKHSRNNPVSKPGSGTCIKTDYSTCPRDFSSISSIFSKSCLQSAAGFRILRRILEITYALTGCTPTLVWKSFHVSDRNRSAPPLALPANPADPEGTLIKP